MEPAIGGSEDGICDGVSVHLERYPAPETHLCDDRLESRMALVRRYVSAGRAARQKAGLKVRQPLASAALFGSAELGNLSDLLAASLNVKAVLWAETLPDGFSEGEDAGGWGGGGWQLIPDSPPLSGGTGQTYDRM